MLQMQGMKARYDWLDFVKGIAMFAVVSGHLHMVAYNNETYAKLMVFSVGLFVFVSGMTSYISMEKRNISKYDYKWIVKSNMKIIKSYFIAVCISVFYFHKSIELSVVIKEFFMFNIFPQFYYVIFYIQLIAAAPALFLMLKYIEKESEKKILKGVFLVVLLTALIIYISWFSTKYTVVLNNGAGGDRFIFGGSFLIVFWLGMLCWRILKSVRMNYKTGAIISVILLVFWIGQYVKDTNVFNRINQIFPIWFKNPPGVYVIIYIVLVFAACYFNYDTLFTLPVLRTVRKIFAILGQYSLTIFLYHWLFMYFFDARRYSIIPRGGVFDNELFKIIYFSFGCFGVPLLIKKIYETIKSYICSIAERTK